MVRFFNRVHELSMFEDIYRTPSSSLIVLYGRRRVGKTELTREFIKNKKSIYLFIETKPEKLLLKDMEESLEKILDFRPRLDNWDDFFNLLFKTSDKIIVVFDEFQNFKKTDPGFFSKFQKYWDAYHREAPHMFIVIGSYVGMIKKIFQGEKEPLFGRATLFYNLMPFTFSESYTFLRGFLDVDIEEAMKFYFIFGGVPKYLLFAGEFGTPDAGETFKKLFIDTHILMEEGMNILKLEFGTEHKSYFSILEAISLGRSTPRDISDYTGIQASTVSKYLHELLYDYEIIKKEEPVIKTKSRSGRYFLGDNFFNFWFRFIYKNYGTFEIDPDMGLELFNKDINAYFGLAFECVAKELLIAVNKTGELPFRFLKLGRWWDKDAEIDLIGFNKTTREILLCEVKWKHLTRKEADRIIKDLKEKADRVKGKWKQHYCLIAKEIDEKERLDYLAFDISDMEMMQAH
ncbi:MAG: ATP-binding protein [ANME-2 cluster archaeon]|nr:ATP-binding protein [ANME-2 cluster archaeon]